MEGAISLAFAKVFWKGESFFVDVYCRWRASDFSSVQIIRRLAKIALRAPTTKLINQRKRFCKRVRILRV